MVEIEEQPEEVALDFRPILEKLHDQGVVNLDVSIREVLGEIDERALSASGDWYAICGGSWCLVVKE